MLIRDAFIVSLLCALICIGISQCYSMDKGQNEREFADYTLISEMLNQSTIQQRERHISQDISFSFAFSPEEEIEMNNTIAAVDLTQKIVDLYGDGVIEGVDAGQIVKDLPGNVDRIVSNIANLGVHISELEGKLARTVTPPRKQEEAKEDPKASKLQESLEHEKQARREFAEEMLSVFNKSLDKAMASQSLGASQILSPPKRQEAKKTMLETIKQKYQMRFGSPARF